MHPKHINRYLKQQNINRMVEEVSHACGGTRRALCVPKQITLAR